MILILACAFAAPAVYNDDTLQDDLNDIADSLELINERSNSLLNVDNYITIIEERLNEIELAYLHHDRPDQYENP